VQERQLGALLDRGADLDEASAQMGLQVQTAGLFPREGPIPGLGTAPTVAFNVFNLPEGEVSGALTSPRGPVFARVTGRADPRVPALEEIRDRVREDATRARALELSREQAADIAETLAGAGDFAAAAEANGLGTSETDLITRESALPVIGPSPEVDRVAFALEVGEVSAPITTAEGTVILRVAERDDVTAEEFQRARETFRDTLLAERRGVFFTAYMNRAKAEMQITTRPDVIDRIVAAVGL
jgi:hypothetical protein